MIEVYKIITEKYEGVVAPRLDRDDVSVTRGNALGLKKFRVRYDWRKYSFTNRVVDIWNSLPNKVVLADSVNCFKCRTWKGGSRHLGSGGRLPRSYSFVVTCCCRS